MASSLIFKNKRDKHSPIWLRKPIWIDKIDLVYSLLKMLVEYEREQN